MSRVAEIMDVLNQIVDPCSVAAGLPAGLVDMGLVETVSVKPGPAGARVSVSLLTTHPFCMMGAVFISEATERLRALGGVGDVEVMLEGRSTWTPDRMSPGYAERLGSRRAAPQEVQSPPAHLA